MSESERNCGNCGHRVVDPQNINLEFVICGLAPRQAILAGFTPQKDGSLAGNVQMVRPMMARRECCGQHESEQELAARRLQAALPLGDR